LKKQKCDGKKIIMVKLAQRLIEALHPFVANVTQVGNVAYFNLNK